MKIQQSVWASGFEPGKPTSSCRNILTLLPPPAYDFADMETFWVLLFIIDLWSYQF